ncbi:MAG: hypothetical protein HY698_07580 [Deltaproteobacteria bacterium]|nr:hypothetical protein [Deltaproteobacteria bacterium]
MRLLAFILLCTASCYYSPDFRDCVNTCATTGRCPDGLRCLDGYCRVPGANGTCGSSLASDAARVDAASVDAPSVDAPSVNDVDADPPDAFSAMDAPLFDAPMSPIDSAVKIDALPPPDARVDAAPPDATAECTPNQVDQAPCGNCGTKTRTCSAQWTWGPYGNCLSQGECAPNSERTLACGNCGQETQTCSVSCKWQAGACVGQGECAEGKIEWRECGECGRMRFSCDNSCHWVQETTCQSQCGKECPGNCFCAELPSRYCDTPCCP